MVRYGGVTAVDRLDLDVAAGEVLGFLGPNGAGKTSTIRTLLDLQRPTSGSVTVLGETPRDGRGALRRRIGYLPGDLALFPDLRGNETLDLFARLQGRDPVARDAVLGDLGFPTAALRRRVRTYSTGMRQMIGLTVALQHDPELLVLDEPTSGLDPVVRDSFLRIIRKAPARGCTVLLSSHVLAEVEACASRVALIHEGRLLLVSTLEEIRLNWPRQIVVHRPDGSVERSTHRGPVRELLARLAEQEAAGAIADLEIRPAALEDVVREVLAEHGVSVE